jgi:hypothetical protein
MATMTTAPRITGHGHTSTGERCFTVESRTDGHWYIVVVGDHSLSCQCKASQYRNRCAHRQAVHDRLVEEREAAKAATTPAHETAILYHDNKPFSIWK